MMRKIQLEPGRKYRGSAWVNEYGEIQFRPEQKGGKPGNLKLVQEHESYSIYESEKVWKVAVKFNKPFDINSAANKLSFVLSQIIAHL